MSPQAPMPSAPAPKGPLVLRALRWAAPFLVFAAFYLIYALSTYKDYSITFDEAFAMEGGQRIFEFYFKGDKEGPAATNPSFLDHNYIYGALLISLCGGKAVPQETVHLLSMLFGLFLYAGAYVLFRKETGHPLWALAGPAVLFLSPVFVGHMPNNFMDAPNAVVFGLAVIAMVLTADKEPLSPLRVAVLGTAFGLAASFRLSGLTLFPALLMFDFLRWDRKAVPSFWTWLVKEGFSLALILGLSQVVMALTWPYLGHDYFGRILHVFQAAANLPWTNGTTYFGKLIPNVHLPWHYLPVWVFLTTPLFLVVFALLGIHPYFRRKRDPWAWAVLSTLTSIFLVWLAVRPVIHSGIRHFLFLLPVVSLWGGRVLVDFLRSLPLRSGSPLSAKLLVLAVVLNAGAVLTTFVSIHPFQYLYYTEAVGGFPGGMRSFEQDYWFHSNKEAIAWIKERVCRSPPGAPHRVNAPGQDWQVQYYTKPELRFMGGAPGDYYIRSAKDGPLPDYLQPKLVHTVSRMGVPLCWVLFRGPEATGQETTPFP